MVIILFVKDTLLERGQNQMTTLMEDYNGQGSPVLSESMAPGVATLGPLKRPAVGGVGK